MVRVIDVAFGRDMAVHRDVRVVGGSEGAMTPMIWAGAILTVFLVGYLVYVLLNPERF
jgi:K+-transporting ATPase KdpF subunit